MSPNSSTSIYYRLTFIIPVIVAPGFIKKKNCTLLLFFWRLQSSIFLIISLKRADELLKHPMYFGLFLLLLCHIQTLFSLSCWKIFYFIMLSRCYLVEINIKFGLLFSAHIAMQTMCYYGLMSLLLLISFPRNKNFPI